MITIIDYKTGNLGSIQNILKRIGEQSVVTSDKNEIAKATKLVLPGVGAFDTGMRNLNDLGLVEVLNEKVINEKTPVLGICLGMQLLSGGSEEGSLSGLGWIRAKTVRFQFRDTKEYKIPHMGWNNFFTLKGELFRGVSPEDDVYFVHSYYPEISAFTTATCDYILPFSAAMEKDNFYATQFHPEKSAGVGDIILKIFLNL